MGNPRVYLDTCWEGGRWISGWSREPTGMEQTGVNDVDVVLVITSDLLRTECERGSEVAAGMQEQ